MAIKRATVRAVKNIPTLVGKTAPVWRCNHRPWKHPHVRGGDKNNTLVLTCDVRNIPTPVGKTTHLRHSPQWSWKHPHACGEDLQISRLCVVGSETSPRLWGRQIIMTLATTEKRNIPTPVGKTPSINGNHINIKKHPHACGEDGYENAIPLLDEETSPRLWGRP